MGLYRSYLEAIQGYAFLEGDTERWPQSAPTINGKLAIVTGTISETRTTGMVELSLVEGDSHDLSSKLQLNYSSDFPLSGFVIEQMAITTPVFDSIALTDDEPFKIDLLHQGERIEHAISFSEAGLITEGITTVIKEKLLRNKTRSSPDIAALLAEMA